MKTSKIHGSMVALVTPMDEQNAIDWEALHKLVEWHIEQGTHAIVAAGTTGESSTLPMDEHVILIGKIVNQVAGRVPVIAGTGANSTSEALLLTASAEKAGADACLLVTPYYNRPSQHGLYLHHKHIAESVAIPQILYNVPGRTAVDMLPETVAKLAKIDNIIGIKEATGSLERMREIQQLVSDDFLLISGDDLSALEFMRAGGCGEISVTANIAPAEVARMCELLAEGNVEAAREVDRKIQSLHKTLFLEANPIPVKWALAEQGKIKNNIRLPLTSLASEYHEALRTAMTEAGVL